jgi:hypothetical protein
MALRRVLVSLVLVFALSIPLAGPMVSAAGTDPIASGNYSTIRWDRYFDSSRVEMFAHITKLTGETDSTYDYYNVANYLKQLNGNARYDKGYINTFFGQNYPSRPVELDWAPGFQNPGDNPVSYGINMGTGGVNAAMSWTHHWKGSWRIDSRGDSTAQGSDWHYSHHRDSWRSDSWNQQFNWNTLSHGNAWQVRQGEPLSVWVHSMIKSCQGVAECSWFWPWHDSELQHFHTWNTQSVSDCIEIQMTAATCTGTLPLSLPPLPLAPPLDYFDLDGDMLDGILLGAGPSLHLLPMVNGDGEAVQVPDSEGYGSSVVPINPIHELSSKFLPPELRNLGDLQ